MTAQLDVLLHLQMLSSTTISKTNNNMHLWCLACTLKLEGSAFEKYQVFQI